MAEVSEEVQKLIDDGNIATPEGASLGEIHLVWKQLRELKDDEDTMNSVSEVDFEVYDLDGSGTMDREELQVRLTELLQRMGATGEISEEFTDALLEGFDENDDNTLDADEYTKLFASFVDWVEQAYHHFFLVKKEEVQKQTEEEGDDKFMFLDIPESVSNEELREVGDAVRIFATEPGACEEFAMEMFGEADEDGDQTISQEELKSMFQKMAEESGVTAEIPDSLVEGYLSRLDQNADGVLSLDEFIPLASEMAKEMNYLVQKEIERRKRRGAWEEDEEE